LSSGGGEEVVWEKAITTKKGKKGEHLQNKGLKPVPLQGKKKEDAEILFYGRKKRGVMVRTKGMGERGVRGGGSCWKKGG